MMPSALTLSMSTLATSITLYVLRWRAMLGLVVNLSIQLDGTVAAWGCLRGIVRLTVDSGVAGLYGGGLLLFGHLEFHAAGVVGALEGALLVVEVQAR